MTKSTRRALLSSVVALVICLTMLIGTTFAWFTDTASTAVNTIQSGTLKVDLVDKEGNSLEGKTLSFVNANEETDILWEPGCTFYTEGFNVVNDGNLALKYDIVVTGIEGDTGLLKVINFELVTLDDDGNSHVVESGEKTLAPNASSEETFYIKGHMDEAANNDYQDKTLENIAITVYATQWTYEYDSNDNKYDKDAKLPEYVPATGLDTEKSDTNEFAANGTANEKGGYSLKTEGMDIEGNSFFYVNGNSYIAPGTLIDLRDVTVYNATVLNNTTVNCGTMLKVNAHANVFIDHSDITVSDYLIDNESDVQTTVFVGEGVTINGVAVTEENCESLVQQYYHSTGNAHCFVFWAVDDADQI